MTHVVVVAPHPDDETLGCGGTLLRHLAEGDSVHWLIATEMTAEAGYTDSEVEARDRVIQGVADAYPFDGVVRIGHSTARLDRVPIANLVRDFGEVFDEIEPEVVYLPFPNDAHSDHRIVFEAAVACTKWFRQSSIRRVLAYETVSETDQGRHPGRVGFEPNVFLDITERLDRKIEILELYEGEVGEHPFPRSERAIRALAAIRGAASGHNSAEAFRLIFERG